MIKQKIQWPETIKNTNFTEKSLKQTVTNVTSSNNNKPWGKGRQ